MRVQLYFPLAAMLLAASPVLAGPETGLFSIEMFPIASSSFPLVSNSDLLVPGAGLGGPPDVMTLAAELGLAGFPVDELNAYSAPDHLIDTLHIVFSVDTTSIGIEIVPAPTLPYVFTEAALGQAAGDIFVGPFSLGDCPLECGNNLEINQDYLGEIPPTPYGEPAPDPPPLPPGTVDNLDAYDITGSPSGLFSLAPGHPYAGTDFGCGSDIWTRGAVGAPPTVQVFAAILGLECDDDVDALAIDITTGDIYFSLAPPSPSLLAPFCPTFPIMPCSPADIFMALGALYALAPVVITVTQTAEGLGLAPLDNIDALSFWGAECHTVPCRSGSFYTRVPLLSPPGLLVLGAMLATAGGWTIHQRRGRLRVRRG